MKFVVVTGMVFPNDPSRKSRPAVVLGMVDGRVAVAPCSTNYERSGVIKPGSVLITKKSPAYPGTSFKADQVTIRVRDTALYSIDSHFVKNCRQIGVLDTDLDKRLGDNLRETMMHYDLIKRPRKFDK